MRGDFERETKYSLVTNAMLPWKLILEMNSDFFLTLKKKKKYQLCWYSHWRCDKTAGLEWTWCILSFLRCGRWQGGSAGPAGYGSGEQSGAEVATVTGSDRAGNHTGFFPVSASACWVLIMTWDLPVCGWGCQHQLRGGVCVPAVQVTCGMGFLPLLPVL